MSNVSMLHKWLKEARTLTFEGRPSVASHYTASKGDEIEIHERQDVMIKNGPYTVDTTHAIAWKDDYKVIVEDTLGKQYTLVRTKHITDTQDVIG